MHARYAAVGEGKFGESADENGVEVETNLSYEEVRRFLHSLWPSLLPYLSSRAQQGLSHALLVVRRSALGDGRVAYSLPELHFEFVSRIDFNLSSDSWSGGCEVYGTFVRD